MVVYANSSSDIPELDEIAAKHNFERHKMSDLGLLTWVYESLSGEEGLRCT